MEKITVSLEEEQAERVKSRVENDVAKNRSQALRQELRATIHKSPRRKQIDVAANALGTVGIAMIGFTFFMDDSIRVLSLVPIIGSVTLFIVGYAIDENITSDVLDVIFHE